VYNKVRAKGGSKVTKEEAQALLVGTVVKWNGDPNDLGTVLSLTTAGFYVKWENGQHGWIDNRGAKRISVLEIQ